jgi:hypothetical protein
MSIWNRKKHNFSPAHIADGVPQALAHSAEEASNRLAEAAEVAGSKARATGNKALATGSKARTKLRPSGDAVLKAQLVKTSRELSRESSDLGAAVESLNSIIKANRKAAAKGRTRLIGGLALGAGLMYHLDAEHGQERRAAVARRLNLLPRGH